MQRGANQLDGDGRAARGAGVAAERLQQLRQGLDRCGQHLLGPAARRPDRLGLLGHVPRPGQPGWQPPDHNAVHQQLVRGPARQDAEDRHRRYAGQPDGAPGTPANGWYWVGAAATSHAGRYLDVTALRFEKTGPGQWDWHWASNYLARFDSKTLKLRSLTPLPSAANVQWSAWLLSDRDYTYIYGVEDLGSSKYQHVARVRGDDLTAKPWEYWTGSGWSADETASARVLEGVANEHSVTRWHDGYVLVTHDTKELFSKRVLGYFSCSPTGPFVKPVELYQTPETGATGSYGNANIITYNSHDHPDLRRGNQLLVSYNVNSLDANTDLYADVSIYRPRFVGVTLAPAGAQ
ncbi:DUF4185 domain-containing protein [Kribbella pittospori]|uniref:DUF4185 domain-containing protein n=1 Tax=Kribbella pittospori TaxID=722689 RepID=UPI00192D3C67|nr:DUF4185 domain-containing protein [Kribbella pittospori]